MSINAMRLKPVQAILQRYFFPRVFFVSTVGARHTESIDARAGS